MRPARAYASQRLRLWSRVMRCVRVRIASTSLLRTRRCLATGWQRILDRIERKPGEPSLLEPVARQGVGPFYDVPRLDR